MYNGNIQDKYLAVTVIATEGWKCLYSRDSELNPWDRTQANWASLIGMGDGFDLWTPQGRPRWCSACFIKNVPDSNLETFGWEKPSVWNENRNGNEHAEFLCRQPEHLWSQSQWTRQIASLSWLTLLCFSAFTDPSQSCFYCAQICTHFWHNMTWVHHNVPDPHLDCSYYSGVFRSTENDLFNMSGNLCKINYWN